LINANDGIAISKHVLINAGQGILDKGAGVAMSESHHLVWAGRLSFRPI
jgi:hypothetical protein